MSFVPFENFLIHVELSHCSDLLQKHEPSLELQYDEPFRNSVLQSYLDSFGKFSVIQEFLSFCVN